jgi:uncharacterized delta-60 repeat protein
MKKMRKWILWTVVAYIMILMLTRNISFGDGEYRLAIGELDTEFNSGGSTPGIVVHHNAAGGNYEDAGLSIYVDNNGKIYVTGYSYNGSRNKDMVIWRYNRDGTLDTTFNGTGIVVHDNAAGKNKVLSVANENRPKTNKKSIIEEGLSLGKKFEKSLPTKPLDPTMLEPISGDDMGKSIYVDSRRRIYVTGHNRSDMMIWRYNSDGRIDRAFGGGLGYVVHNNAAGGNGYDGGVSIYVDERRNKIYVAGYSWGGPDLGIGSYDMAIWRYNINGELDTTFGEGLGFVCHNSAAGGNCWDAGASIYVDSTGKVYVTGLSYNGSRYRDADMVIWKYR